MLLLPSKLCTPRLLPQELQEAPRTPELPENILLISLQVQKRHACLSCCERILKNEVAMIQPAAFWAPDPRGLSLAVMSFEDVLLCIRILEGIIVG
ncbi:hypothetical protein Y1Q_0000508 [Alligator mississippiensis]|uniref:Uncharacterized protein n=1 Tax=Alligator mississippiensis TaxID=8496 RepID=A0A151MBF6_ALLMI|nr:hypothetical protein Y1Q_0000508 [Alligator mississippiensis]